MASTYEGILRGISAMALQNFPQSLQGVSGETGVSSTSDQKTNTPNITEDGLSEDELRVIGKYCGEEALRSYYGLRERMGTGCVSVANTGMVSSGKSSLFNVLVDSGETERFPTGAARTTTESAMAEYRGIRYIDTPGIDVRTEDDELAFATIVGADLIMMVHNIRTGPLNRSEMEWFKKIVDTMPDEEMRRERLLFVCTWKDTRENDYDYANILEDVREHVYEAAGTQIPFFDISVKKYQTGIRKEKELLVERSGMVELRRWLEDQAARYGQKKRDGLSAEYVAWLGEVRNILKKERRVSQNVIDKAREDAEKKYSLRRATWDNVHGIFAHMREKLADAQAEVRMLKEG